MLRNVGARDIAKEETCRYTRPEVYSNLALFCGVEMVAYLTYESDEQAVAVAKKLEAEISTLGEVILGFSDFYGTPHNSGATAVVALSPPLPKSQCNSYISTNDRAKRSVDFLPEKIDPDLIALSFECSGESREEYFPVTYRQS